MIPLWGVALIAYGIWAIAALSAGNVIDWFLCTLACGTATFVILGGILEGAGVIG